MGESLALSQLGKKLPVAVGMLPGGDERGAVALATRRFLRFEFCDETEHAEGLVVERHAVALLTRHRDVNGTLACDLVVRVRQRLPHLPIVVLRAGDTVEDEVCPACAGGADAVLGTGHRYFRHRIGTLVKHELHRARRAALADGAARLVAEEVRDAVHSALEHAGRPRSVRELADSVGVVRKTLDRYLYRSDAPSAERLLGWGRLLAAALWLEGDATNVVQMTRELRFASPCAFRNLLRRYAGMTTSELQGRGGTEALVARMLDAIRGR